MWTDFFDNIFLINLPERQTRRSQSIHELSTYNISAEFIEAVPDDRGWYGLYLTYKKIIPRCLGKTTLILEDDFRLLKDPELLMSDCIDQLLHDKDAWNIFYLGVNTHKNFERKYSKNILCIDDVDGRSTHAIAFSPHGMDLLNEALSPDTPIDMSIVNKIQNGEGKCFCSFPILATQRGGYSDIDKKFDDMNYIVDRFNEHSRHLL